MLQLGPPLRPARRSCIAFGAPFRMAMAGDFRLNEHRAPGAPMQALNVKVPSAVMAELRSQAERLSCYPSSLARELILRGLCELSAGVPS